MTDRNARRLLVWDLPTRVFHWLLVLGFLGAWLSSDDDRYLYIHVFAGYSVFALLVFRLAWGWVGTHHARFHTFAYDWPSVTAYLKGLLNGQAARYVGHNPAGSWAIFLMLCLILAVTISGMLVFGGEEGHGPVARFVSSLVGDYARPLHEFLAWSMITLVGLHLAGVVVESVLHRENLIGAMITGYKIGGDRPGDAPEVGHRGLVAVVVLLGMIAFAGYFFRGYLTAKVDAPFIPLKGRQLADDPVWHEECGDCHLPYHPTLLPARSWNRLLDEQADHFDEDLGLDEETIAHLRRFMTSHAADTGVSEPARKIFRSIPPHETPIRITGTPYWKQKHSEIDDSVWKNPKVHGHGDCEACHEDAEAGTFEDAAMRLP